jgi:hypothetical protein
LLVQRQAIWVILQKAQSNYSETIDILLTYLSQYYKNNWTSTLDNKWSHQIIIEILGKISVGDERVANFLIDIILNARPLPAVAIRSLIQILQGNLCYRLIGYLKECLEKYPFHHSFINEIIWHCVSQMPYQSFYQAWHE